MKVDIDALVKSNQVSVHVHGAQACFSIPWTSSGGNSVSFPVMTGSAARGILGAIYAHPHDKVDLEGNQTYIKNFEWVVDKILILNPIQFESFGNIGRMDVCNGHRIPQQTTILTDVSYIIIGHPHIFTKRGDNDVNKYTSIFNRRCAKQRAYTQPHFGWSKYPAQYSSAPKVCETVDINMYVSGYLWKMLYDDSKDIATEPPKPIFIPMLEVVDGIIDFEKYEKEAIAC